MTDHGDEETSAAATPDGDADRIRWNWNRMCSLALSALLAVVALVAVGTSPAAADPDGKYPSLSAHRHDDDDYYDDHYDDYYDDGDAPPSERGPTGYSLVLPKGAIESSLTAPHHGYPAIDIAVAAGTPFYAVTSGTATRLYRAGGCGNGVTLRGDDGAKYTYCHASRISAVGRVANGQRLGLTGSTGDATGPHLHLQIAYPASTLRCPKALLVALSKGTAPPPVERLPTSGCSY
jgi:murein DD-endopeptidase MepM/ murein hydrolase activator NlpD